MSASPHAGSHRAIGNVRVAALVALPFFSALVAVVLAADPPTGVTRLSSADAQRAGRTISLARQTVGSSTLVEVQPPDAAAELLAVSRDAGTAAVADRVGEPSGVLALVMDDGSQLQVPFPGLLAAAFASDGSWLAVIDGRGALWRLDAASGSRELIVDGPFVGPPVFASDGSLLLLAAPSVEAPYASRLVRLAIGTAVAEPISKAELVYAAFPLDGDDLAIVAHQAAGTEVWRLTKGSERRLLLLEPGAINVGVARDGRIAYELAGEGIFVLDAPGSAPRSVGAGSGPCFSPDAFALLVDRGAQRVVLGLDGTVLTEANELSAFAGSEGCPS